MQEKSRANVLLLEILIAVLFFMLSATVLVQVFAEAHNQNTKAYAQMQALQEAQNVADRLYAAEDPEAVLESLGFAQGHGMWVRRFEDVTLHVELKDRDYEMGRLRSAEIMAFYGQDTELFALPVEKYLMPKEVAVSE